MTRSTLLRRLRILPLASFALDPAAVDTIRSGLMRYAARAAPEQEIRSVSTLSDVFLFAQRHITDYNTEMKG